MLSISEKSNGDYLKTLRIHHIYESVPTRPVPCSILSTQGAYVQINTTIAVSLQKYVTTFLRRACTSCLTSSNVSEYRKHDQNMMQTSSYNAACFFLHEVLQSCSHLSWGLVSLVVKNHPLVNAHSFAVYFDQIQQVSPLFFRFFGLRIRIPCPIRSQYIFAFRTLFFAFAKTEIVVLFLFALAIRLLLPSSNRLVERHCRRNAPSLWPN